ncbi:LuxR C-terminal-related transcriptional regulator [Kribbella sp. NPDC055071]
MFRAELSGSSSAARWPGGQLVGRGRERAVLDRLLDAEHGGVLVLRGEPGVGKTALLGYAIEARQEFRITRTLGVELEMELDYAAAQQLCSPVLHLKATLPSPQRDALDVAFGLRGGPTPNPFLVGLAVLGLLSAAAEERPVLCVVDDAQWLDQASAQVFGFVARRVLAERVVLVFATREPGDALTGLPELQVEPLGHRDARTLLESVLPGPLDERVLERIIVETRGNPLALLELPRGLTPAQLAGGFGLPAMVPLPAGIEASFTERLATLPIDARRLLLVAAADPVGDPALLRRAARQLGIPDQAERVLDSEELLAAEPRVVFRHPILRSAVYGAAVPQERREAHRALAEATDPDIDRDRHAWHRAHAAAIPDESVAADLEYSATRARARGGFAAAAAFLERAAALTPEPSRRAQRALIAAQLKFQSGALDDALGLLGTAENGVLNSLERAQVGLLRAQIAFVTRRGNDVAPLLLEAADRFAALDPALARETYLEALVAAGFAGRLAGAGGHAQDVATPARAALPAGQAPSRIDLLLGGLTMLFSDGYEAAVPILRQALRAFATEVPAAEDLRWGWAATVVSVHLWDDEQWDTLSDRPVRLARETGALADLQLALSQRISLHLFTGELSTAASLVEELQAATEATGTTLAPYGRLGLLALRGCEVEATSLIERSRSELTQRGEGVGVALLDWAEAVLFNGLGRYEEARASASRIADHPQDLAPSNWHLAELIEAAVRAGTPELAADAHHRLVAMTEASGTDWALGIAARCQALLTDGKHAEAFYVEAIQRLGKTRIAIELARAHLLYGEWLRRERRRLDARKELRVAHDLFCGFGMDAFAGRARAELEATGGRARKRSADTLADLTPQEAQIARLAAAGSTNREIATQLFISPSTVEYHLHKAFRKLEVRSRTQLAHHFR